MIDPIGNLPSDPVARLRDKGLMLQQPERERIADEIERLRAALKGASKKLHEWSRYDEISGMLLDDLADEIDSDLGNAYEQVTPEAKP